MKNAFFLLLVPLMVCSLTPSAFAETAPEESKQLEPPKQGTVESSTVEKMSVEDQYLLNIAKGSFSPLVHFKCLCMFMCDQPISMFPANLTRQCNPHSASGQTQQTSV